MLSVDSLKTILAALQACQNDRLALPYRQTEKLPEVILCVERLIDYQERIGPLLEERSEILRQTHIDHAAHKKLSAIVAKLQAIDDEFREHQFSDDVAALLIRNQITYLYYVS